MLPVSLADNTLGRPVTLGKQYVIGIALAGGGRSLVVYTTTGVMPVSIARDAATRLIVPGNFLFPDGLAVTPNVEPPTRLTTARTESGRA